MRYQVYAVLENGRDLRAEFEEMGEAYLFADKLWKSTKTLKAAWYGYKIVIHDLKRGFDII